MNYSVIAAAIVIIIALAILLFLIFARTQIINAFFPKRATPSGQPEQSGLPPEQLLIRAYARRDTGDKQGARRDFEELLRRVPDFPDADAIRAEIARLR